MPPPANSYTMILSNSTTSFCTMQLYAILEARVEVHKNIGQQRDNWNTLLLNNINMITLTAATLAGVAAATSGSGTPLLALKLSTTLLRTQIQTTNTLGNPTEEDVKGSMEKVLALDKAYPLPLLGAMLDKFPSKFEPAVLWPSSQEVVEVVQRKDLEDYERLGNIALKNNKSLAIAGPLLSGIAPVGSAFVGNGSLGAIVAIMAGSESMHLSTETIEAEVEEKEFERRQNGELLEMKVSFLLGRSVSQLTEFTKKSALCRTKGIVADEFASKLF
ncbi:hypothetical protein Fmac_013655 [Flemingia macrophylla]|uniref:F-box protein n=1 Tax=Flemingia macrophylla TaxID=520843 RepID=A0ABD1MTR9_9FABA